jgi:PHD/YefM family antitoxin component YafN of YafNO toxin-antitoxin module
MLVNITSGRTSMDPETEHLLPTGERVWVLTTAEASKHLANLLKLFRSGATEPLIFGDAGQPEAVVIPFEVWRALEAESTDEHGFDSSYSVLRHRLANPQPSVPLEEAAAQIGWDLDEDIDDSDLGKPFSDPNER